MQPSLFDQPIAPYAKGSHTSYKAARSLKLDQRQLKIQRYLMTLRINGPMTDPEIEACLGYPRQSICSIRNAAMSCGLVCRGVDERKSQYGKDCATWQLTDAGMRQTA